MKSRVNDSLFVLKGRTHMGTGKPQCDAWVINETCNGAGFHVAVLDRHSAEEIPGVIGYGFPTETRALAHIEGLKQNYDIRILEPESDKRRYICRTDTMLW